MNKNQKQIKVKIEEKIMTTKILKNQVPNTEPLINNI